MTLGFQDQKATTSRFQDQKAAPSRFQGVFSEDKKQRHRDSKTKKPRHRISAEFWPLSSLIIGRAEFSGSRRLPMFYKIGVPEIFAKFTEISVLESFFDKAAVLQDCSFVKKRHQHMYFCVYIAKFLEHLIYRTHPDELNIIEHFSCWFLHSTQDLIHWLHFFRLLLDFFLLFIVASIVVRITISS